ncbi:TonB-dependent receptor plug domain-containing protein [Novosphingobium pokkalii]|uniref:TonB-dependent receptor plug domain-containing protein n=1 Tax=Novosphingobium pokkalii TaxID=1770194 RepID=UPI00363A5CFC
MIGLLCRSRLLLSGSTLMLALAAQVPAHAQTLPPAAPAAPATPGTSAETEGQLGASIVVVGNRYQAATLQMRSANTVNVISAQDLQHTAVHNVAEALGTVPGINVMNTGSAFAGGVDGASRGEGMFVSVRGLNSEYNINLINGVSVAQGNPYSRGVQLSLLPPRACRRSSSTRLRSPTCWATRSAARSISAPLRRSTMPTICAPR